MMAPKTSDFGLDPIEILARGRRNKVRPLRAHEKKAKVARTARGSAEVVVKVSGGGKTVKQVFDHLTYITRNGKVEGDTEQGDKISSRGEVRDLLNDWGLDTTRGYGRVKLAFNLVLSMPPGTPPTAVLAAAKNFARENFWDNHPYLLVQHHDTDHPHVHICVKAEGLNRKRLYIRKDTLEGWRDQFAEQLREQGVDANATPRDLRGVTRKAKGQGVFFAEKRGVSTVMASKAAEVATAIQTGALDTGPWIAAIHSRRKQNLELLKAAAESLRASGDSQLAREVDLFAENLPPVRTERDEIARRLTALLEQARRQREQKAPRDATEVEKVAHVQLSNTEKTPAPKSGGRGGEGNER